MRVVVTGATGNVGTSLLHALAGDERVRTVAGVARRRPALELPKVTWVEADVVASDLARIFAGADVVVHLAWLIQPSRDLRTLEATNVDGSRRVFEAASAAGVPALVYASSVGAYSPGPKDRAVDETWPTGGVETSFYSRHKAAVERILDDFETAHPAVRVVRLRPGLIFKREAAAGIRRLFAGPFLPGRLLRKHLIPVVPNLADLRFQAVHSYDVGEAYRLAVTGDARGAFNVAAEPVLDPERLGRLLDARPISLRPELVRRVTDLTWRMRLQPTPPGWFDMAVNAPIMDCSRARDELGWAPRRSSEDALMDLLHGFQTASGFETPPLETHAGGFLRARELLTGVGRRSM